MNDTTFAELSDPDINICGERLGEFQCGLSPHDDNQFHQDHKGNRWGPAVAKYLFD